MGYILGNSIVFMLNFPSVIIVVEVMWESARLKEVRVEIFQDDNVIMSATNS